MSDEKVKISPTRYIDLYEIVYVQMQAAAKFLNDTNGLVEDWKYLDHLLHALRVRFDSEKKQMEWRYPNEDDPPRL